MKTGKILLLISLVMLCASTVSAGDFDWMPDFNIRAEADQSGFRMRLATRFHIDDVQVQAVIGNVERPADAYMVLRLGEMSGKPPEYVMTQYKSGKGKGWGRIAKGLGIKPGSKEFHALKRGSDLYADEDGRTYKGKGKGKGKFKD